MYAELVVPAVPLAAPPWRPAGIAIPLLGRDRRRRLLRALAGPASTAPFHPPTRRRHNRSRRSGDHERHDRATRRPVGRACRHSN
jgi:hypothetical protein